MRCDWNPFTSLDVSGCNALKVLFCEYSELTSLNVSGCNALVWLDCSSNQLTSLDVSSCDSLTWLFCSRNQLSSLDVSKNIDLESLDCSSNELSSLDVSNNTGLLELGCSNNQLTTLDVTTNTNLSGGDWYCFGCQKSSKGAIPLGSPGLSCSNNLLSSLDVSNNTRLGSLDCSYNQITSLKVTGCDSLKWLVCSGNQLSDLDISNNTGLEMLDCSGMQLNSLDVSNNAELWSNQIPYTRGHLIIREMPSLHQVCVPACLPWDGAGCMPESTEDWQEHVDTTGCPNLYFTTECTIGIKKTNISELIIYPNPTDDLLTIETKQPDYYTIEITSLNGQLLLTDEIEGSSQQIDLSSFQKGVYLITIRSEDFVTTKKIIKL